MGYEITRRQTTYWDLRCDDGRIERIHFLGKEESAFLDPIASSYAIVEEHAVLIDYQFSWEAIYVASPVSAPDQALRALTLAIEAGVDGWRPASGYLNEFGAERILRDGYGQLLAAPIPIAETSRAALTAAGARFTTLRDRPSRWPRQALIAGVNYVVAKSFRVEGVT